MKLTAEMLRDFIALAVEIAATTGMPLTEALADAADLWPEMQTDDQPALVVEVTRPGPALAA